MKLDNYIAIEATVQDDLIKAIQQFSDVYAETGVTNDLKLFKSKSKSNLFVIYGSELMDLERFKFLVNYLNYPQDISSKLDPKGYWTIREEDKVKNNHVGQRVMFYISPEDTEYDNVFGIFDGGDQTIKFGFSWTEEYKIQEKKEIDFFEPDCSIEDFEMIQTINPNPNAEKKSGKGCLASLTIIFLAAIGFALLIV